MMGCSYRGIPPGDAVVRNPIGANMSFRREVVTTVGGFASDLGRVGKTPLGCEETDLSIRAYSGVPGLDRQDGARGPRPAPGARGRTTWRYFRSRCWSEGLSKAVMTGRVGSDDGLAERAGLRDEDAAVGVAHGIADALRGRPEGLRRAGAIIAGLGVTAAGYARGRAARPSLRRAS